MFRQTDDNPFRIHRDALSQIIARFDPECLEGWNRHFKEKPTDTQLIDYLDINEIKCDENTVLRKQRLAKKRYGDLEAFNITVGFDKHIGEDLEINHDKLKKSILRFLGDFQNTKYKWALDPVAVCEFYSDVGWNPHVHILCKKNYECTIKTASAIQQALHRKYVKGNKHTVYRIYVSKLPITKGQDYVEGFKQDSKQEYLIKDKEYRSKHGYTNIYHLFDL